MDERSVITLRQFYRAYYDAVNKSRKSEPRSLILSSLEVKSNVRLGLLRQSVLDAEDVDNIAVRDLLDRRLVRQTDEVGGFAITLPGIWMVEKADGKIDEDRLIAWLDQKFLNVFGSSGNLNDRESVIILSLVAVRAFSPESCIDLHSSERAQDTFESVIRESLVKLQELDLVSSELNIAEILKSQGTETALSNLLRHTDDLQKKTRLIFSVAKPQRYYLKLLDGTRIKEKDLAYLFSLVLRKAIRAEAAAKLMSWCSDIAFKESVAIFDMSKHRLGGPEYDRVVGSALKEAVLQLDVEESAH